MTRSASTDFRRHGSSYLEVQVAMVLLSIGIGGLYSLAVIQSRQTAQLTNLIPIDQVSSINPVNSGTPAEAAWARKFGVYADLANDAVAAPTATYTLNVGFLQVIDNEDPSGFYAHTADGGDNWEQYGGHGDDNKMNVDEIQTPASYGSFAVFIFENIPAGDYEVFTHFPTKSGSYPGQFGSAVPHHIYEGYTLVSTTNVDQRLLDQDLYHSGTWWERLGGHTFHGDTIYVLISDTPKTGDWLVADAVMLRCRRSLGIVTPVTSTTGGGATVNVELN